MATQNKLFIQIDDERIELTGVDKEAFIADKKLIADANALLKTKYEAKKQARINAITKLGQASGLTETEIEAILNG
jgi:hypothetical protein